MSFLDVRLALMATLLASLAVGVAVAAETPRAATSEEQQILNFLRLPSGQTTDSFMKTIKGGCDFNPYAVLESRYRGAGGITPAMSGSGGYDRGLNPALACRVARLLQFAESRGCMFKIVSAYRKYQGCGAARNGCAAQGRSCHQYGLAADIGSNPRCINWMKDQVLGVKQPNSAFGVHIAYFAGDYSHLHIQCNENRPAVCSPQTRPCDGSFVFTGDVSNIPNPGPQNDYGPNAQNPQPTPQQPPPQQQPPRPLPPLESQKPKEPPLDGKNKTFYPPGTCAPQNYCADGNIFYRSDSCLDQLQEKCPYGCSGVFCSAVPMSSNPLLSAFSTSSLGGTPTDDKNKTSTTTVFDRIVDIGNPLASGATVGTSTLVLTNEITRVDKLHYIPEEDATIAEIEGDSDPFAQQTFSSMDSGQNANSRSSQEYSALQKILDTMRTILLRVLEYLRPFGRSHASVQ